MALKNTDCLPYNSIKSTAEFTRQQYLVIIPKSHTWPLPLVPEYWKHQRLNQHDLLELIAEDNSFDVQCRVVQSGGPGAGGQNFAVLRVLREWHAPAEPVHGEAGEPSIGFVINEGWMLYDASGAPIAKFANEDSATAALKEHLASKEAVA